MSAFLPLVVEAFRAKREVHIETASASGKKHRVPIWIVVVDGVPYVRSVRGEKGLWFRQLIRAGAASVHVGDRPIAVTATRVTDAKVNAKVSDAIETKYDRPAASVRAMVLDSVLRSTAELRPG